jgi:hypothetical protein
MNPSTLARANGLGRIAFGIGLLAQPRVLTRAWIGEDSARVGAQVLTRSLGMRDLVIGAGTLASPGPDRRLWLAAALLADATDLTVTLAAGSALPLRGRVLVSLAAGAGAILGAAALAGMRTA